MIEKKLNVIFSSRALGAVPRISALSQSGQTVADWVARGGVIERLAGFERTSGYLPRCPRMAPGVSVAP